MCLMDPMVQIHFESQDFWNRVSFAHKREHFWTHRVRGTPIVKPCVPFLNRTTIVARN